MSHVNAALTKKLLTRQFSEQSLHLVGSGARTDVIDVKPVVPSPILCTPPEIISRIIELGAQEDPRRFPRLFSQISGRLRMIALENPTFWSSIDFIGGHASYDEVSERLRRSKDAPLDLMVSRLDTREDAEMMLKLLYPHVRRWRSLVLEVWETAAADTVMRALVDKAPLLEHLSISGFCNAPADPFRGQTPALKSLIVRGVPLVWESTLFYSVSSLYVHSSNWTSPALLGKWQNLNRLTIRADPMQPLIMHFQGPAICLPELECLELNGITEEDIVRLLSFAEMPNLSRLLFTHIKDSPNQVVNSIFPLLNVRHLRLHATEMCQDNLLNVLRKVRNLECISFEDSSPIPAFIGELSLTDCTVDWVCPKLKTFQVVAFEKDNAQRAYDDTDIIAALRVMMEKRRPLQRMSTRMCVFQGERNDKTRHAAPWGEERLYKSEKLITVDP
ncbi:hypothetical protein FRB96_000830 [Tulasnella sp. 330]|nr:hypothetical protein FRB96_000830 [Tulasnella sp. 330]KAG8873303.1 hypothetical protein FRB97_006842 [Tulasnella sp. 331]KAG8877375.1 hypothetical protein FRB98_006742 [Tulasnella sp. 332]